MGAVTRLFVAVVTVIVFSFPCLSQSPRKPPPNGKSSSRQPSQLVVVETIKIPSEPAEGFSAAQPLRCDADGNFYLRVQTEVEPAIRKFDNKGIQQVLFSPSSIPDIKGAFATYFSIDTEGEIRQLVGESFTDWYVITYKSNGTYKAKTRLQLGFRFRPFQLAAFPSGELLVSGVRYDDDPNVHVKLPFTAIVSVHGTLLKQVLLKDDETMSQVAAGGPAIVPEGRRFGNSAIEGGAMEAAADGNVYMMRRLSPAIVHAISPGGEVVKQFRIDPGDADFQPVSMQIAGYRIAVLFFRSHARSQTLPEDVVVKVVDLEGHDLATYDHVGKSGMGIALVCYSPVRERFTFLTTTENFLGFAAAEPR
jgi:hypothetical protein